MNESRRGLASTLGRSRRKPRIITDEDIDDTNIGESKMSEEIEDDLIELLNKGSTSRNRALLEQHVSPIPRKSNSKSRSAKKLQPDEFSKSVGDLEKGIEFYMKKLNVSQSPRVNYSPHSDSVIVSDIETISNEPEYTNSTRRENFHSPQSYTPEVDETEQVLQELKKRYERKIEKLKQIISTHTEQLTALEKKNSAAKQELQERDEVLETLYDIVERQKKYIEKLKTSANKEPASFNVGDWRKREATLNDTIASLEEQLRDIRKKQSRSQEVKTSLMQRLKEQEKPYIDLQREHSNTLEEVLRLKNSLHASQQKTAIAENKLKKAEQTIDELNGKLSLESKRFSELVSLVKRFEKAGSQMLRRYKEAENALVVE